jgi:hypothetical protein
VQLDLSRAIFGHRIVDLELHLGTGGAKITVPRDAIVDLEGAADRMEGLAVRDPGGSPDWRADDPDLRDHGVRDD